MKILPRASEAVIYAHINDYVYKNNEFTAFDITLEIRKDYFVDHDQVRSVFAKLISNNPIFGKVYDTSMGCYIYFKLSGGNPNKYSLSSSNIKLISSLETVTVEDYCLSILSKPTSDGRINVSSSVITASVKSDRFSLVYLDSHYMLLDDLSKLQYDDLVSEKSDFVRIKEYSVDKCNRLRLNLNSMPNFPINNLKENCKIQRVLVKSELNRLVRGVIFIPS